MTRPAYGGIYHQRANQLLRGSKSGEKWTAATSGGRRDPSHSSHLSPFFFFGLGVVGVVCNRTGNRQIVIYVQGHEDTQSDAFVRAGTEGGDGKPKEMPAATCTSVCGRKTTRKNSVQLHCLSWELSLCYEGTVRVSCTHKHTLSTNPYFVSLSSNKKDKGKTVDICHWRVRIMTHMDPDETCAAIQPSWCWNIFKMCF